jgi:hypothetical protein
VVTLRQADTTMRNLTEDEFLRKSAEGFEGSSVSSGRVGHYLFNFVRGDGSGLRDEARRLLRAGMCGVDARERQGSELAPGDLVLIYVGAPERELIGRAEVASAVHEWSPSEANAYPGDDRGGVALADIEEWDPPVPMDAVLSRIDSPYARGDFQAGVVLISAGEYETALAVAAERASA